MGNYIFKITDKEDYDLVKEFAKKILSKERYSYSVFIHNDWYENHKNEAIRLSSTYDDMGFSSWEWYQSDYAEYAMIDNVKEFFSKKENKIMENEENEVDKAVNDNPVTEQDNSATEEEEREKVGTCIGCGQVIYDGDDYEEDSDGNYLCEDCRDDYVKCDDCGCFVHEDNATWVYDNRGYEIAVCQGCLDDNYFSCEDCGEWHHNDDCYTTYNDHYICESCRDNDYVTCDDCGALVHCDDYYYSERRDRYYCPNCWEDDYDCDGEITPYHDHDRSYLPCYNDYDKSVDMEDFEGGYGFELEVDDGSNRGDCSNELYDLLGDRAIYEEDGSLSDDGFEIITRPMTRRAMEAMPLEDMIGILRSHGFKSHDSGCCGLHIHTSRTLFGDTETERTENIAKIVLFYEMFWDDIVKVSRRKNFHYCSKLSETNNCESITTEEVAKDFVDKKGHHNHFCSINLSNDDTVEFRIMRGTLKLSTLKATLDFTMTLVENCKNIPMDKIHQKSLWLAGLKPETIEYLKERRAFGYEQDDENED